MKQIAIIDTETSSLDPSTGELLEVAVAVLSLEHRSLVRARSWLVNSESNAAIAVNGIPIELLAVGDDLGVVTDELIVELRECDCLVAHSAAFDRKWFVPEIQARPWACSMEIEWPRKPSGRSLAALALAHGVGVASAHRALDDVMTLARVFERAIELGADMPELLRRALRPKVRVVALVSKEDRQIAKDHGFQWAASRYEWWREMPAEDAERLPFAVDVKI